MPASPRAALTLAQLVAAVLQAVAKLLPVGLCTRKGTKGQDGEEDDRRATHRAVWLLTEPS